MKLVLDKKHGNRIEFLVEGVSLAFANMLRRYSMSCVPVLAIDSVTFYDNNSAFWDEYLAHRVGLMPITTPEKLPQDTEVVFTLDAEGPRVVYSSDLKSSDKAIAMAQEKIPLLTLAAHQQVRLEGKAVLDNGKKHAKFQAGIVSYGEEGKGLRFMTESFFQMEAFELLKRGCDLIESDIEEIEAAVSEKPKKEKKAPAKKKAAKKASKKKE